MQDRIRVAANALIVHDGHALLIEFDDESGLHYNLPGGGIDVGETLEDGVRREVMEETCLDVRVERLLLIVESIGSRNTNLWYGESVPWNELRFFFLCETENAAQARLPDLPDPNQTAVRWVPLEQLSSIAVLPPVSEQLLLALNEQPSRPIIVANPKP